MVVHILWKKWQHWEYQSWNLWKKERERMQARVDEHCIGCGLCVSVCPEVFTLADTGVAVAVDYPPSRSNGVQQAAHDCPVGAIHVDG